MIETYFSRTSTINRLRGGPLGADLDDLAAALQQQGYARESIRGYLRGCDQFARWLPQQGYAVADVNPTLIKRYISRLQRPPSGRFPEGAQGLSHLLKLWRQKKRLPERIDEAPPTEADQWLLRYEQYLDHVCGAAVSTRHHYLRMARRFLAACFGTGDLAWSSLLSRLLTLSGKKQPTNAAVVANFPVLPSDPFSDSWCSVGNSRQGWRPPLSLHVSGAMTRSRHA